MAEHKWQNILTLKKPPRSRSCTSLQSNPRVHIVELVPIANKLQQAYQIRNKQTCKYCILKQKFGKDGQSAKCLAHSLNNHNPEIVCEPPKTPPMKPKKQPYSQDDFTLKSSQNLFQVQRLTSLAKQLLECLQKDNIFYKQIQFPQFCETFKKCSKYFLEEEKASCSYQKSNYGNQSSVQFQLSSFDEPSRRMYLNNSFKTALDNLHSQTLRNSYIRSEIVTSFIHQIQSKFRSDEELINQLKTKIQQYQDKIEDLTKRYQDKIPTDHTIKQFEDDLNFIQRFSQLADISLKDVGHECFGCKKKGQIFKGNQDMVHYLLTQAHSLETVIQNF